MFDVTVRELLEAGVHFGHQTNRWNPKMKPYIYGARNGIYIIDLEKTLACFRTAHRFLVDLTARGEKVLFVGTKKQAQAIITEGAQRCDMLCVGHRWLGGTLSNFQTIKSRIDRLKSIDKMMEDNSLGELSKKEVLRLKREQFKLQKNLGGIKEMKSLPGALFVIDPLKENNAVHEAVKLDIPIVALIDTNCDPDEIAYPVPGNDDAIRSISLVASKVVEACIEGSQLHQKRLVTKEKVEVEKEAAPPPPEKPDEKGPTVEVIRAKPRRTQKRQAKAAEAGEATPAGDAAIPENDEAGAAEDKQDENP